MDEKYLPIGTVVLLENGTKELMITGYNVTSTDIPGTVYDYSGCLYPEGIIRSDINCVFNHSQIDSILYFGYISASSQIFLDNLKKAMNKDPEPFINNEVKVTNFEDIERL